MNAPTRSLRGRTLLPRNVEGPKISGRFPLDEELLRGVDVTDLSPYGGSDEDLDPVLFLT